MFVEIHPKGLNRQGASVSKCIKILNDNYDNLQCFRMRKTIEQSYGIKKLCQRFGYLYLSTDPVEEFSLNANKILKMDNEVEWGTFWAVAH